MKKQTTIMGYSIDVVLAAEQVVDQLKTCKTKQEVLDVMTGVSIDVFRFIDEKPGYFYRFSEHRSCMLLRQLRNDPTSRLFELLS